METRQRWQDLLNLGLGLWLVLTPFMGYQTMTGVAAFNSYIFGAIIAVFSLWAILKPQKWEEWINLVLGLWLIVAPFVLGFTSMTGVMLNGMVVGFLVGGDAIWAMLKRPMGPAHHVPHHA